MASNKIPIKNIYYMLCYAWNTLAQSDSVLVGSEDFDNIYELLGNVFTNGINSLIKRGINKYYINEQESMPLIKGKLKLSDSLKSGSIYKRRLVCQYDDFADNIILNQIIKTTISYLIKSPFMSKNLKSKLVRARLHFNNVKEIELNNTVFHSLRFNKNNYHYHLLISISELLYNGLISTEHGNELKFADFIREKQMANLFEKFILNFYKLKLDKKFNKVHSPKINWDINKEITAHQLNLLPEMRTDIVIENQTKMTQLIIDAKYYASTLVTSNYGDTEKIRVGHLYQLYAYVNNSKYEGEIRGMLVYPTIEEEINASFPVGDKILEIKTLNLNDNWSEIEKRLFDIIDNVN